MKHFILDEHSNYCDIQYKHRLETNPDYPEYARVCGKYHEDFLFFHLGDFYLLSARKCLCSYSKHDFLCDLLKNSFNKTKIKLKEPFRSGYDIDKHFAKQRKAGLIFDSEIREVNYIYHSAVKAYCITSVVSIFDALDKYGISFYNNHDEMEAYLIDIDKEYLLKDLKDLQTMNFLCMPDQHEVIKTIDGFTKQLKEYANN